MKMQYAGILSVVLALSSVAVPLSSFADTSDSRVLVNVAPPAPKMSPSPTPSKVGYVWSAGYWAWNGTAYVWNEGSWIAVVEAKKWIAPTWTQEGNKWYFTAGHWA